LDSFLPAVEMILKAKAGPVPPPANLEALQKERARLAAQTNVLEQTVADLRTRLDRATKGGVEPVSLPNLPIQPKILLVDDRTENLSALEALMGDLNATTVRAASGSEALERLL